MIGKVPTMPPAPEGPQPKLITLTGTRSLPHPDAAKELLTAAQHQSIKQGVMVKPGETVASVMKRTDFAVDGTLQMLHPVTSEPLGARENLYAVVDPYQTVRIVPVPEEPLEMPDTPVAAIGALLETWRDRGDIESTLQELDELRKQVLSQQVEAEVVGESKPTVESELAGITKKDVLYGENLIDPVVIQFSEPESTPAEEPAKEVPLVDINAPFGFWTPAEEPVQATMPVEQPPVVDPDPVVEATAPVVEPEPVDNDPIGGAI